MRIVATALLVAMAVLFLVARRFEGVHPAIGYLVAFTEAAMVGGLADWFAVTALFRHPLGVPIPHTAIIPANKDRIADTMAGFLRDNFLTPTVVARRMRDMNLARAAGDFLAEPRVGGQSRIREGAAGLLAELLESLDPERLGNQVRAGLARQAERIEVSPLLGSALEATIAEGRHRPLLDSLIRWIGHTLEKNEDMVRAVIHSRANAVLRWTGLDERLANSVLDGLYRLLAEVLVDPEHPLRKTIEESLAKLAHDLAHDPELRQKVEAAKREILANPAVGAWWMGVWEKLRHSLIDMARDPNAAFAGQLGESLAELGRALRQDPALQWQVNRFARRTVVGVATRYGGQIVQLVSETVRRWDARTVTDRIERAVGRDLQFIRINGTLVGGLVGVTIHALSQWL
ncbi:MAG: DUF445 domain-containing protein [Altererythrobacter sp.]|nr:DUF445 domain-containing protein [Altererythrobacter sp.]